MGAVFSLVSCVAAVHGIRAAMQSLKQTGTDFTSAQGMDPRAFFEVMGMGNNNDSEIWTNVRRECRSPKDCEIRRAGWWESI